MNGYRAVTLDLSASRSLVILKTAACRAVLTKAILRQVRELNFTNVTSLVLQPLFKLSANTSLVTEYKIVLLSF